MALTDIAVRNAKGRERAYKMADSGGLYLLVNPDGGRYWRFDYRFDGKRKTLALGVYPQVGLVKARGKHLAARELLEEGKDPAAEKKREKVVAQLAQANTLRAIGDEWLEVRVKGEGKAARTYNKLSWLLGIAYEHLGDRVVAEIRPSEVLAVLKKVEAVGHNESAVRLRSTLSRVFRYAIATDRAELNPAGDLQEALTAPVVSHHAGITDPKRLGPLLRAIDVYQGEPTTKAALQLAPHVFVRPGELRMAEWPEFDLRGGIWRIPGEKMKMKLPHIVPLSKQAVAILRSIHPLTKHAKYVFPSLRQGDRPLSENTLNAALVRLGYSQDEQTPHGFRTTASTLLNEQGWNRDWVERQLAHVEGNKTRRAYNAAEYLPDRVKMMQCWSDFLDKCKETSRARQQEILELIG